MNFIKILVWLSLCDVYFVGEGAGHLNIKADCMNLQKTYEVYDCAFKDRGTSTDYTAWTNTSNLTIERDTYTTLSQTNTGSTANQYLSIDLTNATVFEFDVCVTFSSNFNVVSFRQNSTNKLAITATDCGLVTDTWTHIKITVDNGTVSLNVDGVDKTTKTLTDTVNRLYVILSSGIVFKYKDFLVYPAA